MYLGDFIAGQIVHFMWSTNGANGASITRATNGTVSVYKGTSTTQSIAGITDTEDFDTLTGIHHCAIETDADGAFYDAGSNFIVVLSGATIDGQIVNAVLAHFSIQNRAALRATVAGRTLDVTATGASGVDWANVQNPTTTVGLSGTTVGTATTVTSGVTVTTNNDKTGYSLSASAVQAIWDAATSALVTAGSIGKFLVDELSALTSRLTAQRATNLDNLDAPVSSRLASAGYTPPPSAATNAAAVRSELAPELGRVDVPISTRSSHSAADVWSSTTRTLTNGAGVKKNAALANFPFKMVDSNDEPLPGLSVTAQRQLDGGAFAACANAVAEVANGWYKIDLAASDLNGDTVVLQFSATGAKTREFIILTEP